MIQTPRVRPRIRLTCLGVLDPGWAAIVSPPQSAGTSRPSSQPWSRALITALSQVAVTTRLATGDVLNLDFHAVSNWRQTVLENHKVPARWRRTRRTLTFFVEDADTHALL